jgi:alpha-acetolactate decarboxylase
MSELEFLGALDVELLRHRELRPEHPEHELFQTSTVQALLGGAYDGDVTLAEILEHGDLGLGTLDGLDGELIVLDGQAWKAELDGTLVRPPASSKTPYAVVVAFSPGEPIALHGPFAGGELEAQLGERLAGAVRPTAVRIDGRFSEVHVRSVPRQQPPYRPLAEVICEQQVNELRDVSGTMMGFSRRSRASTARRACTSSCPEPCASRAPDRHSTRRRCTASSLTADGGRVAAVEYSRGALRRTARTVAVRARRGSVRVDALSPLRAQRPAAPRDLARPVAELRRRPPAARQPGDPAPRV